jgi:hypothetical protein
MELLQEAGFHPLEVIPGGWADLVSSIGAGSRISRSCTGTGALKLNDTTGRTEWVGGIKYTVKDGIVYDANKLLADVAAAVEAQKRKKTSN